MKRIVIILSVIFLMIDSVAVKAQNEITELFNRIKAAEGVRSSVTEFRNEKNGIKAETKIFDLIVGQQQWGFFDLIKDAFEKEKNGCYFFLCYTGTFSVDKICKQFFGSCSFEYNGIAFCINIEVSESFNINIVCVFVFFYRITKISHLFGNLYGSNGF